ncbi:MAG TPA: hypothetical protein VGE02_08910 [Gemmatimonadales bacterium]|jgi:hypothetical protein
MTIMQMLVTGMILIIIATVTLAVLSYGAFKVRERRAPRRAGAPASGAPLFFERVRLNSAPLHREE